jgi:hypothetical protein
VSPDVEAYLCYLLVLVLGIITASVQVSAKLKNLPGKWIMLNTWLLFAGYTAIPLALFWFLDRTNAIHDTSIFAAILVGVGYQQILSTGLSSIRAPSGATKLWQPFDAWANSIAGRIRDRIAINDTQFDEKLLTTLIQDKDKFEVLKDITLAHITDVVQLDAKLKEFDSFTGILNEQGVRAKKALLLYTPLRQACP